VVLDVSSDEAMATLFTRANPRGWDEEIWRHTFGCRAWMVLTRHRVTHVIEAVRAVGPEALP
jgi:heterotetrameric sarcosine oxidase delta subunit